MPNIRASSSKAVAQVDCFMLPGMIRALEAITECYIGRYRMSTMEETVLCAVEDSSSTSSKVVGYALDVSHFLVQPHTRNAC